MNSATGWGGPALGVTTSCGGVAATSLVAKIAESVPALLIAKATGPLPGTDDAGSGISRYALASGAVVDAIGAPAIGGALAKVSPVSVQLVLAIG